MFAVVPMEFDTIFSYLMKVGARGALINKKSRQP